MQQYVERHGDERATRSDWLSNVTSSGAAGLSGMHIALPRLSAEDLTLPAR